MAVAVGTLSEEIAAGTRWTVTWSVMASSPTCPASWNPRSSGAVMSGAVNRAVAVVGLAPGATPSQVTGGSIASHPGVPGCVHSWVQVRSSAEARSASPVSTTTAGCGVPSGPVWGVTTVRS